MLIILAFAIGYLTREWSASAEAKRLNDENANLREWLRLKTGYTIPTHVPKDVPIVEDEKPNPLMKPPKWNNAEIGKPPDLFKAQAKAKMQDTVDFQAGQKKSEYFG